jgi:hypothetical protein
MPLISIQADVRSVTRTLDDAAKRQVPFAAARALTALAFAVQRAERAATTQVFEHPRPFTQRSVLVDKATKVAPAATVYVRPEAAEYLAPYEFGGVHHLPGLGRVLLNPKSLKLDPYGQIRGKPRSIGDRRNVFVGTVKTKAGPVWGFWQRLKVKAKAAGQPRLKLLVRGGEALAVHKRLGFEDRARAVVQAQARAVFDIELAKAIASAR